MNEKARGALLLLLRAFWAFQGVFSLTLPEP